MKHNKNILKISLLGFALTLGSCDRFLDVNTSPNNPEKATVKTLLPTALAGTAFANSNELNRFASTIMSVTAGVSNSPSNYDIYLITGGDFTNQWNFELYGGAMVNYYKLIKLSEETKATYFLGVGKIMLAYSFALTTDVWGDIPYLEALQGDLGITAPKLTAQKDIYLGTDQVESLFDLVKSGLKDLDETNPLQLGGEDIVYQGNISKWKRAGNSLLLKLATQISLVEPAKAKAIYEEVIGKKPIIEANDQNLAVNFGGQVGSTAPIWTLTHNSLFQNDLLISTRFVNLLKSKDDPRLPLYVTKPSGDYVTIDNGFRGIPPQPKVRSTYSSYVTGINGEGPTRLITASSTSFNIAEAILRLGISGDAQEYYKKGIAYSLSDAGLSNEQITQYSNTHADEFTLSGTNENKIKQIITQKYISQFSNGLEQWNDWRRTGYPDLPEHQNAGGEDGKRPVRAIYLFTEQQRNPNFPQGTSVPKSNEKLWWDIN